MSCVDMCAKVLEKLSYFCYVKCLASSVFVVVPVHISIYNLLSGSEICVFCRNTPFCFPNICCLHVVRLSTQRLKDHV